mmetsp:Transcript_33043/g.72467  ORF Transcript_33043/g.72467 Transcript_33043/m.72467 type:complete len:415 (+) Transcript_33043:166-1410(+)
MSTPTDINGNLPPAAKEGIDFEGLPWNMNCVDSHKYLHLTTTDVWKETHYDPKTDSGDAITSSKAYATSPLPLYPSTTSLNYGTTIWEGLKCYRTTSGTAAVFRPDMNWKRFSNGAKEMCLPAPSLDLFLRCVQTACRENADLIPPYGEGMKLYVRPMLLGSGQQLGLYPSPEFSMLFFVSPTGNYFKGKAVGGLKLHLETNRSRAARGGLGSVKCSGNYAVTLRPLMDAKKEGFDDNLYLELDTYQEGNLEGAIIQELSAANIFLVLRTGEIVTPSLGRKTILPGVTRDSILVLAREYADELRDAMVASTGNDSVIVTVSERDVKVEDLKNASEVFITGTAAEVVPVASLATGSRDADDFSVTLEHGKTLPGGPVTSKLLDILRQVMVGTRSCEATRGWLRDPFASAEVFRAY